jgi:hypothetical protein
MHLQAPVGSIETIARAQPGDADQPGATGLTPISSRPRAIDERLLHPGDPPEELAEHGRRSIGQRCYIGQRTGQGTAKVSLQQTKVPLVRPPSSGRLRHRSQPDRGATPDR